MRRLRLTPPIGIVILIAMGLWVQPLRDLAFTIIRLPLSTLSAVVETVVWLPQLSRVAQEQAALRQELVRRQQELLQLRDTVRRLTQRQQLHDAFEPATGLIVTVIGRPLVPTQQAVVVNRGARDGVVADSILVTAEGVVGRVVDVQPTTSVALLITDPDSRIGGVVERSRESGLVVGTARAMCRLVYLDLEADMAIGDRVVTAGVGGPFPKGLPLGTVTEVVRDVQTASAWARLQPAAPLGRLEELLCVPPAGDVPLRPDVSSVE